VGSIFKFADNMKLFGQVYSDSYREMQSSVGVLDFFSESALNFPLLTSIPVGYICTPFSGRRSVVSKKIFDFRPL